MHQSDLGGGSITSSTLTHERSTQRLWAIHKSPLVLSAHDPQQPVDTVSTQLGPLPHSPAQLGPTAPAGPLRSTPPQTCKTYPSWTSQPCCCHAAAAAAAAVVGVLQQAAAARRKEANVWLCSTRPAGAVWSAQPGTAGQWSVGAGAVSVKHPGDCRWPAGVLRQAPGQTTEQR